ncbi:MAG: ribonuclease D [Elusimicrobiota bacterium]
MSDKELPPARMIATLKELESFAKELKNEKSIAVDIESDGFYVYHEKVCLVQLTTSRGDFIVDPLAVKDMSPLGPMFRNAKIQKLFHAGEYDIVCLKRDFGFTIKNIFDTMVASRILGEDRLGLARLIEKHFQVKISKKLQRANWGKRPLTPEQCKYARLDTHYLHALRDILTAELEARGLLQDAIDAFAHQELAEPQERKFSPDDFWHIHGARELPAQKRAVLRALYLFREKKSAALDRAPFRVLSEQLLVIIAEKCPKTLDALRDMRGMTPYLFNHFGKDLHKNITAGLASPPIEKPPERNHKNRWDSDTMRRYEALRAWRKQLAAERGVNPVVILATDELREVSQAPKKNPSADHWLDGLSEHKQLTYGKALLEVLNRPIPVNKGRRRRRRSKRQDAKKPADE